MTLDGSLRDNDFRRRWERVVEDELRIPEDRRLRLVALGDTHLNFGERLPAEAAAAIAAAEPDALLHTGDIAWLPGLAPLAEIAPIYPVRGNRDILDWRKLPAMRRFRIGRRSLLLFHGYGSSLVDYLRMRRMAARRSLALRTINLGFPSEAASDDFLVYGHTHLARVEAVAGRVIVNPGALTEKANVYGRGDPKFAVIELGADGAGTVEIRARSADWHVTCILHFTD